MESTRKTVYRDLASEVRISGNNFMARLLNCPFVLGLRNIIFGPKSRSAG